MSTYSQITPQLSNIINRVRRYTKSPSTQNISDQEVVDAINTYYLWDLPSHLKLLSLQKSKSIFTEPNVDVYDFETNDYFDIQPPVYISGYNAAYFQDKSTFYGVWPKLKQKASVATGNGGTTSFPFTLSGTPVLRSREVTNPSITDEYEVIISSQQADGTVMTLVDIPNSPTTGDLYYDVAGVLTQSVGSSINYITGAVTAIFPNPPGSGVSVEAQTTPYVASRPSSVWFYQNTLTLRPVPDDVYELIMTVIIKPSALLTDTDQPEIQEWYTLLSMGAARVILQERLDRDQLMILDPYYREQLDLVENRTLTQLGNQRTSTLFSSPGNYQFGLYNALQGGAS